MTLGELRTAARLRLHDIRKEKYRWANAELNGYINEAVNEACIRARLNLDSSSTEATQIDVVAGTAEYLVHESVFFIERAYLETSQVILTPISFHDLDVKSKVWPTDSDTPENYIPDLDSYSEDGTPINQITLYPNPEATETCKLTVYRLPLCPLQSDSSTPEIHFLHHPHLIDWVCHKAYMNQDADSLDAGKAIKFGNMFEKRFGPRPSARLLEWQRKKRPKRTVARWL